MPDLVLTESLQKALAEHPGEPLRVVDPVTKQTVIPADKPNCNSCHVQHVEDKRHWNPSLFSQPQQAMGHVPTTHDASLLAQSGH